MQFTVTQGKSTDIWKKGKECKRKEETKKEFRLNKEEIYRR